MRLVLIFADHHYKIPVPRKTYDPITGDPIITISAWDEQFLNILDNETFVDLIRAADYLDMECLSNVTCRRAARFLIGKSLDEVKKIVMMKLSEDDQRKLTTSN